MKKTCHYHCYSHYVIATIVNGSVVVVVIIGFRAYEIVIRRSYI